MPSFDFLQLDVFAARLFEGNPLAVVVGADALDAPTMQRIARWTNLSETTFLLRPTQPDADYRVRIFTPRQELPFAGHPSVGSAYAAIEAGCVPARSTLVQECAAGLLPVQVQGSGAMRIIHVQAPPARIERANAALAAALADALKVDLSAAAVHAIDNGPLWLVCDLGLARSVRTLAPDLSAIAKLCLAHGAVGVGVFGAEDGGDAAMAVRAFCPADGIPEDPVTGSANAAIGALLHHRGDVARYGHRYVASQGREVGRDGRVAVSIDAASGTVTIGGQCVAGVRGTFTLDHST
ncbi:PhzF family phenazine biosynthesis protein [Frateuria soli]|uniref:PhzF family phenazine biosynthesis protein n=1 Tax=Frateuria soli TaxID=1542730 RepID=UPI001E537A9C|nr:PhzF family phenazine biosynthesis protein [Frateuria soli]UGB38708.1 PhzF family phenazine biosynthesis protein [Frateuria soli]